MINWNLNPQWDTLPNGLRLGRLMQPHWQRSLIQATVAVGGAQRDLALDGRPRSLAPGTAHLLEHVVGRRAIQALAARPEIRVAASTGWWTTSYSIWLTEPDWPLVAGLLAALAADGLDAAVVEHERQVVAREIAQREADPVEHARRTALEAIYHCQPIRQPVTGRADDLRAITLEQLEQLHAWFYTAAGLSLWIAGPLAAAVDQAALGAIRLPPSAGQLVWRQPFEPDHPAQRAATHATSAAAPAVRIAFKDDPGRPLAWRRLTSELLLEGLLGPGGPLAGSGGRVEYCGGQGYGHSLIEWRESDPDAQAARLAQAIERLAASLDDALLDSLRRRWRLGHASSYEQPETLLRDVISLHTHQSSLDELAATLDCLRPADLRQRLEEHFRLERAAVITLRPRGAARQAA